MLGLLLEDDVSITYMHFIYSFKNLGYSWVHIDWGMFGYRSKQRTVNAISALLSIIFTSEQKRVHFHYFSWRNKRNTYSLPHKASKRLSYSISLTITEYAESLLFPLLTSFIHSVVWLHVAALALQYLLEEGYHCSIPVILIEGIANASCLFECPVHALLLLTAQIGDNIACWAIPTGTMG